MTEREIKSTMQEEINILTNTGMTEFDAIKHLKIGVTIYDAEEFEEHFDQYMEELVYNLLIDEEECKEEITKYREMLDENIPVCGWDVTWHGGKRYFLEYSF